MRDAGLLAALRKAITDALDLAEFSTVCQRPPPVHFVGYRSDGSKVTTDMVTDGIIDGTGPLADFETFYLDEDWTVLTRVEMPTYGWSLDNVVVSAPEPGSGALVLLGGALALLGRRKRREAHFHPPERYWAGRPLRAWATRAAGFLKKVEPLERIACLNVAHP